MRLVCKGVVVMCVIHSLYMRLSRDESEFMIENGGGGNQNCRSFNTTLSSSAKIGQ